MNDEDTKEDVESDSGEEGTMNFNWQEWPRSICNREQEGCVAQQLIMLYCLVVVVVYIVGIGPRLS